MTRRRSAGQIWAQSRRRRSAGVSDFKGGVSDIKVADSTRIALSRAIRIRRRAAKKTAGRARLQAHRHRSLSVQAGPSRLSEAALRTHRRVRHRHQGVTISRAQYRRCLAVVVARRQSDRIVSKRGAADPIEPPHGCGSSTRTGATPRSHTNAVRRRRRHLEPDGRRIAVLWVTRQQLRVRHEQARIVPANPRGAGAAVKPACTWPLWIGPCRTCGSHDGQTLSFLTATDLARR